MPFPINFDNECPYLGKQTILAIVEYFKIREYSSQLIFIYEVFVICSEPDKPLVLLVLSF